MCHKKLNCVILSKPIAVIDRNLAVLYTLAMNTEQRVDARFFWDRVKALAISRYGGWLGLEEASGLSSGYMRKAYSHKSVPCGDTVARIADALHVPAISLFPDGMDRDLSQPERVMRLVAALGDDSELLDVVEKILKLALRPLGHMDGAVGDDQ